MENKNGRKKNGWFFGGMFLLIALSVGVTYYRYVVSLDYLVVLEVSCDPQVESCFLYECDPEEEWAECSENPADDSYYYKYIKKKGYAVVECVNGLEGCEEISCAEDEEDCTEILCEDSSFEELSNACHGPDFTLPTEDLIDGENEAMTRNISITSTMIS